MKKISVVLLLMLLFVCALGFSACSSPAAQNNNGVQPPEEQEELPYYQVTVINGIGSGEYKKGATVTIMADIKTGFEFAGWSDGNTIVSVKETYSFVVTQDVMLTATYTSNAEIYYDVIVKADGVSEDINYVLDGDSIMLEAIVPDGYRFKCWTDDKGIIISEQMICEYTPTKNITIVAKFVKQYTLEVKNGTGGGVYDENKTVRISANSIEHKMFRRWIDEDGNVVSKNSAFDYTITSDATLTAEFIYITHTILVDNGEVIGKTQDNQYVEGSNEMISANQVDGKYFVGWYVDGNLVSTNNPYLFEVEKDTHFVASYLDEEPGKTYYNITIKADGTTSSVSRVEAGNTVSLSAIVKAGKRFVKWVDSDGNDVSLEKNAVVTVDKEETYIATFVNQYSVVVDGGTGSGTYDQNYSLTIKANEKAGYRFDKWTINGIQMSTNSTYTFNVTSNVTIKAEYVKQYYISVNGGTGTGYYDANASVTVLATVPTNSRFVSWKNENNIVVSTNSTYTFNATKNTTLTANCVKICTVVVTNGTGGGQYDEGTEITITANIPSTGMVFVGWKKDGGLNVFSVEKSITVKITQDVTYVAVYELDEWTEILP